MTPEDIYATAIGPLVLNDGPDVLARKEWGVLAHAVRADVAMLSPRFGLHLVEIKSDRDTLKRLPYQVEVYSRVAERCTLVCARKHIEKALPLLPDWWSVWPIDMVGGRPEIGGLGKLTRIGSFNPAPEDVFIARLLHVEEAREALRQHGGTRGTSRLGRFALCRLLTERLNGIELQRLVYECLRVRPSNLGGFGPEAAGHSAFGDQRIGGAA